MNEGSIYARATLLQSVSLPQSAKQPTSSAPLLKYPEVSQVMTQTGRPNDGSTDATDSII